MMKRTQEYKVRLELANLGNVATRYELKAQESSGTVHFRFAANGSPLVARQMASTLVVAAAMPVAQAVRPEPARPPSGGGLAQTAKNASGASNAVADLLMTVGYILPRSIGMPLINIASQMRYSQYAAQRVSNIPRQIKNMAPGGQPANSTYVGGSGVMPPSSAPVAAAAGQTAAVVVDAWTSTPIVQPGGSLMLDLLLVPADPTHAQHCSFTVLSRATEDVYAQPLASEGDVQITGVSALQRVVPWLVFGGITILGIACSIFLIMSYRG
jgi:hypothetical protein